MMKTCIDCGARKKETEFYLLRRGEPARQSRCKPCDNSKRTGNFGRSLVRIDAVRRPDGTIELVKRYRDAR